MYVFFYMYMYMYKNVSICNFKIEKVLKLLILMILKFIQNFLVF